MIETWLHMLKNSHRGLLLLWLLIFIIAGALMAAPLQTDAPQKQTTSAIPSDQKAVLCSVEDSFSAIAQRVEPGVVSVTSVQHGTVDTSLGMNKETSDLNKFLKKPFKDLVTPPQSAPRTQRSQSGDSQGPAVTAEGSGTIVRRDGDKFYVLTNYHVVEDAYRASIRLADETDLKGIVVGIDPITDLAVVQISSSKLSDRNVVPLGDSNLVKVGAWALAMGSPYGFEHTLTIGVISAVQRELNDDEANYPDLIQTDAAINKGNSGGPLLDVEGRVIGINAAIASPTGGSIGLGFAIPVNTAKAVLDDLISQGRVVRGWFGAGVQELTPVLQEYYGTKSGVLVASVDPKGPAAKAGVQGEDILLSLNNTPINEVKNLQRVVSSTSPGTILPAVLLRNGSRQSLQVQIGLSPSTPKGRPVPPPPSEGVGIRVKTLTSDLSDMLGLEGVKGVLVIDVMPGSPAETAGLEEGDVVVSVSQSAASSDKAVMDMLEKVQPGGIVVLKILRKGVTRFIGFRME